MTPSSLLVVEGLLGVFAGQALLGAGIGVGWAQLGALLMAVAPPADRDVAGPFITTTQTLAAVFGSALAGMLATLKLPK
jgi:predicted MFS family arabinose efflux permease